jgi:hypothetical protein
MSPLRRRSARIASGAGQKVKCRVVVFKVANRLANAQRANRPSLRRPAKLRLISTLLLRRRNRSKLRHDRSVRLLVLMRPPLHRLLRQ